MLRTTLQETPSMAKASFRATVSPRMGSFQMNFRALGITYGGEVRADADPSPNDVSVTVRSLAANKKCVFFWYPQEYLQHAAVFKDALKAKSVIELFDLILKVEGYGEDRASCKGTTVKRVFAHYNGEEVVELVMKSVIVKRA
jgi:hypothetical protein